jgi:hypothetical protein
MDAAQMLTAQEIARQCEQLARTVQQRESAPESATRRHLRLADPVTEPIARVEEPAADTASTTAENSEDAGSEPVSEHSTADGVLSDREWEILAFERQWWKHPGDKEQAIRELFDMSASRYYQLLNVLVDKPEALEADPMLIKRLRKGRANRQRVRSARRLGIELH